MNLNSEHKVGSIPATVSTFGEHVPNMHADRDEEVEVWSDTDVPQIMLQVRDTAFCFGLAEAEILETAIRVARQSMRRR